MKRDHVSAYIHMKRDGPSPCTQLYSFWMWLPYSPPVAHVLNCLVVSCFIYRNLTLPSFKKDVFGRNDYFFSNKNNFCCHESTFFT